MFTLAALAFGIHWKPALAVGMIVAMSSTAIVLSSLSEKALLRTPGLDRFAKSPRAFLDALATPVVYSFANTTELLADTPIRCPPFESYVEGLVEFVQHRLREKRARETPEIEDPLV